MTDTLQVLLLADDRPGHIQLSEGIIAAVAKCRPVDVLRRNVTRSPLFPNRLLAPLVATRQMPEKLLRIVFGLDAASLRGCGLVVSAGGNTLAANILAARSLGVPNLFYGSLRQYNPRDFSIAFTSYEHQATRSNIVPALKPSRLDPDAFPLPTRAGMPLRTVGLLLGGDGSGLEFDDKDWTDILALCVRMHDASGTRFLVANSRRTPAAVSDRIAAAANHEPAIAEFVDVRSAGPGTLPPLFTRSEAVLASADSSSMVSESIWLRRPTLALYPRAGILEKSEQTYRAQLAAQGLLAEIPIAQATPAAVAAQLQRLTPLRHNPLDALAEIVRKHLPDILF